jgi:hypothetical protein
VQFLRAVPREGERIEPDRRGVVVRDDRRNLTVLGATLVGFGRGLSRSQREREVCFDDPARRRQRSGSVRELSVRPEPSLVGSVAEVVRFDRIHGSSGYRRRVS